MEELLEAPNEHRLLRLEKQWPLRLDLAILDELGYVSLSRTASELLVQVLATRYEQERVMIMTNLEFAEWGKVFGDEKMRAAILDRLTHQAHILPVNGESCRFKESVRR